MTQKSCFYSISLTFLESESTALEVKGAHHHLTYIYLTIDLKARIT